MDNIFEIKDKTGRVIYLSKERWKHILKHPKMNEQLEEIQKTLKNPLKLIDYGLEKDIKYYYRYYKGRKSKARYLRVIVKYLNGKGYVVTAYFINKIK